jgi:hypothetical protein
VRGRVALVLGQHRHHGRNSLPLALAPPSPYRCGHCLTFMFIWHVFSPVVNACTLLCMRRGGRMALSPLTLR